MSNQEYIKIEGAYENNLKHISLDIPKKQITIFTGVSGSGKSSLVLDTIAASSRRELNETFPSFVQQYLPKYGRPHVDRIGNLPVAIVIDQRKPAPNARSTVGTYTDIYSESRQALGIQETSLFHDAHLPNLMTIYFLLFCLF